VRCYHARPVHASRLDWTCPTCGVARRSTFCPDCGERAMRPHDLTLVGLGEQAIEAVAHVDGRLFATFRTLVTRPGVLTESYLRGQRRPYYSPLQTFLVANLIFFAFQSVFHANVF